MKLLFDHNLSFRLVAALRDLYPGSVHVREVELQAVDDEVVWDYARDHGFLIVSKDAEFHQRSLVLGAPPKFVWIRLGNCSTDEILALLRAHHADLLAFERTQDVAFLVLG
mgnify:CR=1 FL=1